MEVVIQMNATFINKYESDNKPLTQDLYKMSYDYDCDFIEYKKEQINSYLVASRGYNNADDKWEVLLFESDKNGKIISWIEVYGEHGWHDTKDVVARYLNKLGD